jgi:hypothetical protein
MSKRKLYYSSMLLSGNSTDISAEYTDTISGRSSEYPCLSPVRQNAHETSQSKQIYHSPISNKVK